MGRICIRRTIQRICGLLPFQVQFLFWFPEKGKLGAGRSNHREMGGGAGVKEVLTLYENLLITFLVFPHSHRVLVGFILFNPIFKLSFVLSIEILCCDDDSCSQVTIYRKAV
jgi:hypothetical protein